MIWYEIANYARPNIKAEIARGEYTYVANHYLPEKLRDAIHQDLVNRDLKYLRVTKLKPNEKVYIDLGGMVMADRHIRSIDIDGVSIQIPSSHIPMALPHIVGSTFRTLSGIRYYKHHFWFRRCICLLEDQHDRFVTHLREILPECEAIEAAENELFNKRISQIPAKYTAAIPMRPVKIKKGKA